VIGVRVVQNEKPLADSDITDAYPEQLAQDSELASTVRTYLKGPATGKTFTPAVHTAPIATTRLGRVLDDRGFMVVRLAEYTPSRVRELEEARDEIVEMWREHQVRDRARKQLDAMRDKVTAGDATLEEAAATDGLEIRVLRRFNRSTPERTVPISLPGATPDPALVEARDRVQHRNRILRDYSILRGVEPGEFRKAVLLDDRTEGAYLIRVDAKNLPTAQEIQPYELRAERITMMQEQFAKRATLMNAEALKARFQLTIVEPEKPADDEDPAEEDETADR